MQMTLLAIVQSVLTSMDSDSVSSINDTIESTGVAEVAKEVYYELMSYNDWKHLYEWRELEAVGDTSRPNYLRIPDSVAKLDIFKYDVTTASDTNTIIEEIKYLSPEKFINVVHNRNSSDTTVDTVTNSNGVEMFIVNNRKPYYWTSFDDEYIVTDAYNSSVDTTLNSSKSSAWCRVSPSWTASNTFIPDLPIEFFPAYLAEVKATCHLYFKQQVSQKDEQKSRRGLAHVRRKERIDSGRSWKSYGR